MAVDSGAELLKGIITRLLATAGVTNVVGSRVYSNTPQATEYPFVVVSLGSEAYGAKDFSAMSHRVLVKAYSRAPSPKECLTIRGAVATALDRQEANVTVTGFSLVKLELSTLVGYVAEPDGITWQSFIEFHAVVN